MVINNIVEGHVSRLAQAPIKAKKGGYLFRGVELAELETNNRVFIMFPEGLGDAGRPDLYCAPLTIWENSHVRCLNLQANSALDDGSLIFTASPESQIIIEPHHLVTVTEAIEASQCWEAADLRLRRQQDEPFWMAKGRMVHSMFQSLINGYANSFIPEFDRCYKSTMYDLTSLLLGSSTEFNPSSIESEARTHYRNMRYWIEANVDFSAHISTEKDIASCFWGLKGRLDLSMASNSGNYIMELKSGKYKAESHLEQALVYSLLLAEATGLPANDSQVFYSLSGQSCNAPEINGRALAKVLNGRNRIVALNRRYVSDGDSISSLEDRAKKCLSGQRCFVKRECHEYTECGERRFTISNNKYIQDYYDYWFKKISLDVWNLKAEFSSIFDNSKLEERLENRSCLKVHPVNAPKTDVTDNLPLLATESPEDLGVGESVIIHAGNPCCPSSCWGIITKRQNKTIRIETVWDKLERLINLYESEDCDNLFLEKTPFIRNRELSRQALHRFIKKGDENVISAVVSSLDFPPDYERRTDHRGILSNIYGKDDQRKESSSADMAFSEGMDQTLNHYQIDSITAALASDTYHLIQGPPGSGKTRVMSRLIRQCLDNGERVLLSCPTNIALDQTLSGLIDLGSVRFIRIGPKVSCSDFLVSKLGQKGNRAYFVEDVVRKYGNIRKSVEYINDCGLIAATCHQVMSHPAFLSQRFDRVVLDEAGQVDEPSALGVIALGPKFVLGGDHQQLPPIANSSDTQENPADRWGLERSLFERLFLTGPESNISRLPIQYRMNETIQDIVSQLFYDGMLAPAECVAKRRLSLDGYCAEGSLMAEIIDPDIPVVFVDTPGAGAGKANLDEADAAASITGALVLGGVPMNQIGIITPYRAQQALIRERMTDLGIYDPSITINTVDRFQGGEREVIILSLSRSDNVTSFLADEKRLNVSLSRARSKLILIGHRANLEKNNLFESILSSAHKTVYNAETRVARV